MTRLSPTHPAAGLPSADIVAQIRATRHTQPVLVAAVLINIGLVLLGLAGLAIDGRQVLNAPVWAKTTKFALSVLAYCGTLAWMLTFVQRTPRAARWIGNSIGALLVFEMALIVTQAVRGVPMHYNVSTPLDGALYSAMSIGIMTMWLLTGVAAILLLRERTLAAPLAWGMRLGIAIAMFGMVLAFSMTGPNATQQAALEAGRELSLIGAHNVNALADGETRMLPFLGWNMDGGDLRIAHFIGIHALQVVPLAALLINKRRERWLTQGHRVALVCIVALNYAGLTWLTFWQAQRDQSIIAPDALTLGALLALLVATGLAVGTVLGIAKRTS
jgi:hypothetical protein